MAWNLPPGVTYNIIDPPEEPCEVCGNYPDDCICPECPTCGLYGDPDCYKEVDLGICGGLFSVGHSLDQQISKLEYDIKAEAARYEEWLAENTRHLNHLKLKQRCLEHAARFDVVCPGPQYLCSEMPCCKNCPAI